MYRMVKIGDQGVRQETRAGQAPKRLHFLDNLKVVALLLGLFVHGDDFVAVADQLTLVKTISSNFRMATFYFLSGFFGVMVATKRGYIDFYKNRFLALAIPLIVGVIFLNGITIPLKDSYRAYFLLHQGEEIGSPDTPFLLHLWFLVCLLVFVILAPLLTELFKTNRVSKFSSRLSSPRLAPLTSFGITLAVVLYCVAVRALESKIGAGFLVRSTFYFLPFFALGALLYAQKQTERVFYRIDIPSIAFATGLAIAAQFLPPERTLAKLASFGSVAAFQCAITFSLLWFFRKFVNVSNPLTRVFSRSVYSIYLLHYLLLTVVSIIWIRFLPSSSLQAAIVAVIVAILGLFIHVRIIERSAILLFLFNGKLPRPRAKADNASSSVLRP